MKKRKRFSEVVFLLFVAIALTYPCFVEADQSDQYTSPSMGEAPETAWWIALEDPALTDLIDRGLQANLDLHVAKSRIQQARAVAAQTLAPVLPQISVELTGRESAIESLGSRSVQQMEASGENLPDSYRSGSAMLVGRMDVDLYGRRILAFKGAQNDTLATRHDRDAMATAIAVAIAQTYYEILAGRERLDVVKTQIRANEQLLELVQLRYERGDASGLDVLQQKQQLASTATQLPLAQALLEAARQQLSVLLGKQPKDEVTVVDRAIPSDFGDIPMGQPSDLVTNRPELRSAAANLKAQSHRKTSAFGNFFPGFQVYGQAGEQASHITQYDRDFVWEVGVTVSIPLFQGGSNIAGFRQAQAAGKAARYEVEKQSLEAIQRVENARTQRTRAQRQIEAFRAQLEAASLALQQSKSRYVSGLSDYQAVLTALNAQQQAELNVIEARTSLIDAHIALLDSVGGPWTWNLFGTKGGDAQ